MGKTLRNLSANINPKKIAGITLGLCAVSTAAAYIGGILGQFAKDQEDFYAGGGLFAKGDTFENAKKLNTPDFSFFDDLRFAFTTKQGHIGMLVMAAALLILILFIKHRDMIENQDTDGRGFLQSGRGTYGTGGWMTPSDFKRELDLKPAAFTYGYILGELKGKLVSLPNDTVHNRNMAIYGGPGTGKTTGYVISNIIRSCMNGESIIVTDPKCDLSSLMYTYLVKHGYCVKIFNLVHQESSDAWNCLREVRGQQSRATTFVNTIMKNTSTGRDDVFWTNSEMILLKACVLYVSEMAPVEQQNMSTVYHMITCCSDKELDLMFSTCKPGSPAKIAFSLYKENVENKKITGGIKLGLGGRLQTFQDDNICRMTSYDDIDLTLPAKQTCAYFICISDQDSSYDFISSLFFSFCFQDLVDYADSQDSHHCDIPVNFILDEFPNIGEIPDFQKKLSTMRSRWINVAIIFQSVPQLKNRYPMDVWREILGDCDTQLFLGCTDDMTAEYISKLSGDIGVVVSSQTRHYSSIRVTDFVPEYRQSSGEGKRVLLTPDEVRRLPNDQELLILRSEKFLKLNKFLYKNHPESRKLKPVNIFDHVPEWKNSHRDDPVPMCTFPETHQRYLILEEEDEKKEMEKERRKETQMASFASAPKKRSATVKSSRKKAHVNDGQIQFSDENGNSFNSKDI